ncbi:MAG: helix-turn-helix transcriptional regulator [Algisphaera sp.]
MPPATLKPTNPALWHIQSHGREVHPAGKLYWWDNAKRATEDTAVIQLCVSGTILYRDHHGDRPVPPGTLMLFQHGNPVLYGQPTPLTTPHTCRWIGLHGAGLSQHLAALIARHGPLHHVGLVHPLVDQLERLIVMAQPGSQTRPTELASAIHHYVMNLHDHAEQQMLQKLSPVEQGIEALLAQPHQPRSLKEIAFEFNVSREHLSRTFQNRLGQSAHTFLAEAKRQRALALLRQTRLPLAEVARQAGYANTHSFARNIRNTTGQSPTDYRKTSS